MRYIAREAGCFELHVWAELEGAGSREALPGSPFPLQVSVRRGPHDAPHLSPASGARCSPTAEGFGACVLQVREHVAEAKSSFIHPHTQPEGLLKAGERLVLIAARQPIVFRPQLRDRHANASSRFPPGALTATVKAPDGVHPSREHSLLVEATDGKGNYVVVYEPYEQAMLCGRYAIEVKLDGVALAQSPIVFDVTPGPADALRCYLDAPSEAYTYNAVHNRESFRCMLHAVDEFDNALTTGGALILAKAQDRLSGLAVNVSVEDLYNGCYLISFTWQTVGECEIGVRIENREMVPVKVAFSAIDQDEQGRLYRELKAKTEE